MRRELITWGVMLGIVLAGFVAAVIALNSTLYSASGFVQGYVEALARHDSAGALELVGENHVLRGASDALLVPSALGELSGIRVLDEQAGPGDTRLVTVGYLAGEVEARSTFEVQRTGTLLGLFPTWGFVSSPLGLLQVTPRNDPRFSANGIELLATAQDEPTPYLVFVPSITALDHESTFLQADATTVIASRPGAAVPGMIEIRPNAAFVKQVQDELNEHLDGCAEQEVLLPTGCPFGQEITNRIITTPEWSIAKYPQVRIVPGPDPASWFMPRTTAAAHLVVEVRSLFDGTLSTFDEDVPFTVSYLIHFQNDDELLITAQYE